MAYSKKVVDRFNDVLNNPASHGVGAADPAGQYAPAGHGLQTDWPDASW